MVDRVMIDIFALYPKYSGKFIKILFALPCRMCGKDLTIKQIKRDHNFCSLKCSNKYIAISSRSGSTGKAALAKWREENPEKFRELISRNGISQVQRISNTGRIFFQTHPEHQARVGVKNIRKAIAAQKCSPSGLENRIFAIIMSNGFQYDFTGDLRNEHIGGRYPDFKHYTLPIVLEVASKSEKEFRKGYPWQQYETETISHYASCGYHCIVIWSDSSDEFIIQTLLANV